MLSRGKYGIEEEEKGGKYTRRALAALRPRSAVLQFSTAIFLAALSPCEFRRTTEADSAYGK